jgi:hypothetical protein
MILWEMRFKEIINNVMGLLAYPENDEESYD